MRTDNLLQSYMNNIAGTDKQDRNLDIDKVLSNKTFLRPLPAKGHLVNDSFVRAPYNIVNDIKYDIKSFHKSLKGNANDHELGKINDIGMKLGGLAIAGYLMAKKQTPFAKIMELIGFATFFVGMELWPAIALQLPAKLIHGVNIRQKYKDSDGRKKLFYQDPQYIPWDLLSDEKINKIGNKMNVPENIPNRRDFIQEKMRKVAVQNNTLWMLTAGFATPIMSALMCKLSENPVKKAIVAKREKDADTLLAEAQARFIQFKDTQSLEKLEEIYKVHKNQPITEEVFKVVCENFTKGLDEVTSKGVRSDLKRILLPADKKYYIDESIINKIHRQISETIKPNLPDFKMPDVDSYRSMLEKMGFLNKETDEIGVKEIRQSILFKTKRALTDLPNADVRKINLIMNKLLPSQELTETIKSKPHVILNDETIEKLKQASKILTNFKAKNQLLDRYVYLKYGDAPDTVIANAFNDVTKSMLKIFKFTDKEITATRHDRKLVGKLLREKLEAITSNDEEYNRVVSKLGQKIMQFETKLGNLHGADGSYFLATVNSVFDSAANEIRSIMPETANCLAGVNGNIDGSLKNVQLSFVQNRILGVKSSLYRFLNTLDFYKRISDGKNIPALHEFMPIETKEEIVEFSKGLTLEGTTSDYMTKFHMQRNPNPNPELGNIVVKNGKVQNKYFGKAIQGGRVDLAHDKAFFQEIMKLLYENEMHPETKSLLSGKLLENLMQYRESYAQEMGDYFYFAKPHHNIHGTVNNATSEVKFLKTGLAPDQMFRNVIKETFNTRKWIKIFGGFGAGLLATTIIAQFFLGRIKTPPKEQK